MIHISDGVIVFIDSLVSLFFAFAVLLSFRDYKMAKYDDNIWLMAGAAFVFLFIMAISNVLEWAQITSALDPAEDYIAILVIIMWPYIFLNLNKER